jgi:hypothetical protein
MTFIEDGDRKSPFPAVLGRPVGSPYSEEWAAWVRHKVREHLRRAPLRQLRLRQVQMLAMLRQALIEEKC